MAHLANTRNKWLSHRVPIERALHSAGLKETEAKQAAACIGQCQGCMCSCRCSCSGSSLSNIDGMTEITAIASPSAAHYGQMFGDHLMIEGLFLIWPDAHAFPAIAAHVLARAEGAS